LAERRARQSTLETPSFALLLKSKTRSGESVANLRSAQILYVGEMVVVAEVVTLMVQKLLWIGRAAILRRIYQPPLHSRHVRAAAAAAAR